jgi:hypothetical protein
VAAIALGVLYIAGAQAVNQTGKFELDGNAISANAPSPYGPADDWDRVCHQVTAGGFDSAGTATGALCTSATNTNGATAVAWTDATGHDRVFQGGGSKDFNDPQNDWLWASKSSPDKDTLLHSFAARYSLTPDPNTCPVPAGQTTCEVIFFGADRFANDGDAQMGFWFFQNKVAPSDTAGNGGFKFDGHHLNGDLLVISDFSNGGTTANIKAFKWDTTCLKAKSGPESGINPGDCAAANLRMIAKASGASCSTTTSTAPICGIVNPHLATDPNHETAPWPFTDKGGNVNIYDQGELYEAGINLSNFNLGGECFSSVLAETRASDSVGAVLKDFISSKFGECTAALKTQVSDAGPVLPGAPVHDTLTVTSSQPTVTATGTVTWYLCGPIATGACDGTINAGSSIGTSSLSGSGGVATTDSPDVNTSGSPKGPGRYCFRAEWPGDTNFTAGPYKEYGGSGGTNECFTVKDTTAISTTQKWLPQDTASITTGSGGSAPAGTVVFSLYASADCTGTATTFTDSDGSDGYATNNTTYRTSSTTISWSATFTPTDTTGYAGSTTTKCEKSVLTIDNAASDFPPPGP